MSVQVITHEGQPQYAVLPWDEYQALLSAAGLEQKPQVAPAVQAEASVLPAFTQLAALREAKGLSQQDMARSVGVSPHYLAMIESGEREPDAAIRRSLAWQLGLEGWA